MITRAALVGIFVLSFLWSFGQNWHPFPGNGTVLYQYGQTDTSIWGMKIDSVVLEGDAVAFYFMLIDRQTCWGEEFVLCNGNSIHAFSSTLAAFQDNYFGRKMLKYGDSLLFVATAGDSFLLRLDAQQGEPWHWAGNDSIWLDSIGTTNLYGIADSIKIFERSDGQRLVLGKSLGIIESFSFLPFCEYENATPPNTIFRQFGIPDLGLGRDIPRGNEWTNQFGNGDEICFRSLVSNPSTFVSYTHIIYGDTVPNCSIPIRSYLVATASSGAFSGWSSVTPPCPVPGSSFFYGLEMPFESNLNPGLFLTEFQRGIKIRSDLGGRMEFSTSIIYAGSDTCANIFDPFESSGASKYVEGIGRIEEGWSEVGEYRENKMIGYKIGTETWGSCPDLQAMAAKQAVIPEVQVWPNPTDGLVNLSLPFDFRRIGNAIKVFSVDGRILSEKPVSPANDKYEADLGHLPAGCYLLVLERDGEVLGRAKVFKR
jgi:hypothetical protein